MSDKKPHPERKNPLGKEKYVQRKKERFELAKKNLEMADREKLQLVIV